MLEALHLCFLLGGRECSSRISPWRFGNGGSSLGNSSSHNYAPFLERNIIQIVSNVTDSRSQTNL